LGPWLGHQDSQWLGRLLISHLQRLEILTQVLHEWETNLLDLLNLVGLEKLADLVDTGLVAMAEGLGNLGSAPLGRTHFLLGVDLLQVLESQFQDVGLFQLGDGLPLHLHRLDQDVFDFVQAFVDAGSSLALQQRLHDFAVLVSPGHGGGILC